MKKELLPILEEFSDDVERLCKEIEMLRDQKSDMQKTIDELNEKITELETAKQEIEHDSVMDAIEDNK